MSRWCKLFEFALEITLIDKASVRRAAKISLTLPLIITTLISGIVPYISVQPVSAATPTPSSMKALFGPIHNYTKPADIIVSIAVGNNITAAGNYALIPPPSNPTYMLSFQGYDFNNKGEVSVLVNGQVVATLPTSYSPQNAKAYVDYSLNITKYVVNGDNTLTFKQNMYSSGVRNIVIKNATSTIYSNSTYYSMQAGGSRPSVTYRFSTTSLSSGILSITTSPVNGEVFVNSVSLGVAPVSKSVVAGSYAVSFGSVSGYTTPSSTAVSVTAGVTASVTGTYVLIPPMPSSGLHVNGNKIVDASNVEVKMVGLNYGQFEAAYWLSPRDYAQEAANIKNDGFNAVRLVVQWGALETSLSASDFTYNEANFTDVLKMVKSLTDQGLYVIIVLHSDGEPRYQYSNLKNFLGDQYCNTDPNLGDSYDTELGDHFYDQSAAANSTGPFAHFTRMWEKISSATRNNSLVVGYDLLNEPWTCVSKTASQAVTIRAGWMNRVSELIADLRSKDDNKIIFYEPAPIWWRYGDDYQGLTFTKQSDNNVVYSWHWYEGTSGDGSRHACPELSSIENLTKLWSNISLDVNVTCKNEAVWLKQAQDANPNIPFDIGEFGSIYTNSVGDVDQTWIRNSILLFKSMHVTGYFYWASLTTGTWVSDIQASLPWTETSSSPLISTTNILDVAVSAYETGSTNDSSLLWSRGGSVQQQCGNVTVNLRSREYARKYSA